MPIETSSIPRLVPHGPHRNPRLHYRGYRHRQNLRLEVRVRCHELAGYDTIVGRPRPEFGADLRSIPHGNYIIFFRYRGSRLEVMRIVEGHRDIGSQFDEHST